MRGLVVLLALAGCDRVFGIEAVPIDARADGGGSSDAARDAPADSSGAMLCLMDSFSGPVVDAAHYDVTLPQGGGAVDINGGALEVTWVAGGGAGYGTVATKQTFDLRGGVVSADVDDMMGDMADAELILLLAAGTYIDIAVDPTFFTFEYSTPNSGNVRLDHFAYQNKPLQLSLAFDDAGNVTFAVTTSGGSATKMYPVPVDVSAITPALTAGPYGVSTMAGRALFDNFSVSARACGL